MAVPKEGTREGGLESVHDTLLVPRRICAAFISENKKFCHCLLLKGGGLCHEQFSYKGLSRRTVMWGVLAQEHAMSYPLFCGDTGGDETFLRSRSLSQYYRTTENAMSSSLYFKLLKTQRKYPEVHKVSFFPMALKGSSNL